MQFPTTRNPDGTFTENKYKSVCRIMGFFRYTSAGTMTFKNQEVVHVPPEELSGYVDPTLYAVLHCQNFSYGTLQANFIRKFLMMDDKSMYILPAQCIKGPLVVVPDIEAADRVSLTN